VLVLDRFLDLMANQDNVIVVIFFVSEFAKKKKTLKETI